MVAIRYREDSQSDGGLRIWEQPREGAQYTIGVDCAGGGAAGDNATAVVIENQSCDLVALYSKRADARPWGVKAALLGWKYNEALLAFETWPSTFGLAACQHAKDYGYGNLFTAQRMQIASLDPSANLGWRTDSTTKPLLIERIKLALLDRHVIPSRELVEELGKRQWVGDRNKIVADQFKFGGAGHDDLVIAYGIALCVRDLRWSQPPDYAPKPAPKRESELIWDQHEAEMANFGTTRRQRRGRYAWI